MKKLIIATTLFLTLATASGAVPYSAADKASSVYAVGPGLNDLSVKDGRASYQWTLKNNGQAQKIVQELNIDPLDPAYVHRNKRGKVDAIALLPLEPANILTSTIDAVPGVDINIQPAWQACSQIRPERLLTVVIVDTGVDISHPDLQGPIWVNEDEIPGDGIDNDGNGFVDDVSGWSFYSNTNQIYEGPEDVRGTHVAGTIAVSKDNGGIVGITDNSYARTMPVKALGGEDGKGFPENVIAAIKYTGANGAQICNLSSGSQNCTEEFKTAIRDPGMFFIVATGNGDDNAIDYNIDASPTYPAPLPSDNVITVANLMLDGTLDVNFNFDAASVDTAAPGTFILGITPDNGYTFMNGISMAAPMATGVAAMLYTSRPELDLPDIKNVILASVRRTDSLNGKVLCGGMVDTNGVMHWGRQ